MLEAVIAFSVMLAAFAFIIAFALWFKGNLEMRKFNSKEAWKYKTAIDSKKIEHHQTVESIEPPI